MSVITYEIPDEKLAKVHKQILDAGGRELDNAIICLRNENTEKNSDVHLIGNIKPMQKALDIRNILALIFKQVHTSIHKLKLILIRESKVRKHPNLENKVFLLLNDKSSDRWKSVDKISAITGIQYHDVIRLINESGRFILSYNKLHQKVIATRERYRKEEPFLHKLVDAYTS